ncbi:MAG: hypothetical protein K6T90_02440 [Leptolyngbyaceae cyanobacterium HOT.MB2.61]|nr:hypothetical protein [Leptolyngbyaceae cyanobacterium HOT.MB2.61]
MEELTGDRHSDESGLFAIGFLQANGLCFVAIRTQLPPHHFFRRLLRLNLNALNTCTSELFASLCVLRSRSQPPYNQPTFPTPFCLPSLTHPRHF